MKVKTVQILWHEKQAIFTVDFQPFGNRLATGGADSTVRIWEIHNNTTDGTASIEFLSTLNRHSAPVNCVKWSHDGKWLASGGDDGAIFIWEKNDNVEVDEDLSVESWKMLSQLRGSSSEIYDLCWSPDNAFILCGCLDHTSKIFSLDQKICIHVLTNHSHFVQGVSWDPKQEYIVTQSCDRSVCVYGIKRNNSKVSTQLIAKHSKIPASNVNVCVSVTPMSTPAKMKSFKIYHDDTLMSFFRRPAFSPDGSLLATPTGQLPLAFDSTLVEFAEGTKDEVCYGCLLYSRAQLKRGPVAFISGHSKPSIAIRWNPNRYRLTVSDPLVRLPWRFVFAVITQDSIYIYDTQQRTPIAYMSQLHYSTLTDAAWSLDGTRLIVSSTDGFCSLILFEEEELGQVMSLDEVQQQDSHVVQVQESEQDVVMMDDLISCETLKDVVIDANGLSIPSIIPCDNTMISKENHIKENPSEEQTVKKRRIQPIFLGTV